MAGALSKHYKNTIVVDRSLCCKMSAQHFIEGIAFERARLKDDYYVWAVVSPLWIRLPYVKLNYSYRLNTGLTITGTKDSIVANTISMIEQNDELKRLVSGPELTADEFLETCKIIDNVKSVDALDMGIGLALVGKLDESTSWLQRWLSCVKVGYTDHNVELAQSLVIANDTKSGEHLRLIHEAETNTRYQLGCP